MTNPDFSHPRLRNLYVGGALLALALFAAHTMIIFETAFLVSHTVEPLVNFLGIHTAGPLIILACFFILFVTHLLEGLAWALLFWKTKLFPNLGESLYFAGTSISALGYGDIVLRPPWRALGPIMAINGILMFGCSTAFLFFVIQKIWRIF